MQIVARCLGQFSDSSVSVAGAFLEISLFDLRIMNALTLSTLGDVEPALDTPSSIAVRLLYFYVRPISAYFVPVPCSSDAVDLFSL